MEIKKHFALFSHFTVDVRTIYDKKYEKMYINSLVMEM